MIFLLFILIFVLAFLCLLLFSPLTIEADTRIPELSVKWKGLVTMRVGYEDEVFNIDIMTLFYKRRWRPGMSSAKKGKNTRQVSRQTKDRKRGRHIMRKIVRVVKSFRITRMEWVLDTSDPVLNAGLFPMNFFTYPAGRSVRINFLGENYLVVRLKNTPWRILKAWIGPVIY